MCHYAPFTSENDANQIMIPRNDKQIKFYLLNSLQLPVASITHSNVKLKAHNWNIDSIHGTFITNGFATMTAVMLTNAYNRNEKSNQNFSLRKDITTNLPICRWSIIARKFQKKGRVHNWHVSDSTHSGTSLRIAFISQKTSTESSPAEINCCVELA